MANFGIFMIYLQLAMLGQAITMPFQLPMILQFVIFFFTAHRIMLTHLRILAIERFMDEEA